MHVSTKDIFHEARRTPSSGPLDRLPGAKGSPTKTALMDAARSVFSNLGFSHSRVQDIHAAAGFTSGAFYRYFRDKDDILHKIVDQYLEKSYATTFFGVRYNPRDPMQSLFKSTLQMVKFTHLNRDILKILWETSQFDPWVDMKWNEIRLRICQKISKLIYRAQEDGISYNEMDAECTAELLTDLTENAIYHRIVCADATSDEANALAEQLTVLWGRILFARQAGSAYSEKYDRVTA